MSRPRLPGIGGDGFNWPIDPNVKAEKSKAPPDGHPGRCQARASKRGGQCKQWSVKGTKLCKKHGGASLKVTNGPMPHYGKYAGETLKKLLEELAKEDDSERMRLAGEVDATRLLCGKAMETYEKIVLDGTLPGTDGGTIKATASMKVSARAMLQDALKNVRDMIQAMSKVEALRTDKIHINNAAWIADRIIRIIHERLGAHQPDMAKAICKDIEEMKMLSASTAPKVNINIG